MQYHSHVYIGPTLSMDIAKSLLTNAHYHPPIKCGDIIRLLRLKPKRIIIIDGLYEAVPAVWHKEILLALELGIEVWGAASMGALRAAELYQYGMRGFGDVFADFQNGILIDDDEVAVLHHHQEENYKPINDAMVNIRATCKKASLEGILALEEMQQLIDFCKMQFYPYRSLAKAIDELDFANKDVFSKWIAAQGMIDLKQNDAIALLCLLQKTPISPTNDEKPFKMPVSKFIASLIDEAEVMPFDFQAGWIPEIENKLHVLFKKSPTEYRVISELAKQLKQISTTLPLGSPPDIQTSLNYINHHQLYSPLVKNESIDKYPKLFDLYKGLLHQICIHHISKQMVKAYLPTIALYFNLPQSNSLLDLIIVLTLLSHKQISDQRVKIKQNIILDHLRESGFWFRYHQQKQNLNISLPVAIDFIAIYMQVTYIYQGFRDVHPVPSTPQYFNWIYDAFILYEWMQEIMSTVEG